VRYRDLVADQQSKATPPCRPGQADTRPGLDRPPAARPWRAPWPGDLGKSGQLNW